MLSQKQVVTLSNKLHSKPEQRLSRPYRYYMYKDGYLSIGNRALFVHTPADAPPEQVTSRFEAYGVNFLINKKPAGHRIELKKSEISEVITVIRQLSPLWRRQKYPCITLKQDVITCKDDNADTDEIHLPFRWPVAVSFNPKWLRIALNLMPIDCTMHLQSIDTCWLQDRDTKCILMPMKL